MLDPNKYIDRLRVIVKDNANEPEPNFSWFNRVTELIKDYDRDFDKAMEEMEREVLEMKKVKKNV